MPEDRGSRESNKVNVKACANGDITTRSVIKIWCNRVNGRRVCFCGVLEFWAEKINLEFGLFLHLFSKPMSNMFDKFRHLRRLCDLHEEMLCVCQDCLQILVERSTQLAIG